MKYEICKTAHEQSNNRGKEKLTPGHIIMQFNNN